MKREKPGVRKAEAQIFRARQRIGGTCLPDSKNSDWKDSFPLGIGCARIDALQKQILELETKLKKDPALKKLLEAP